MKFKILFACLAILLVTAVRMDTSAGGNQSKETGLSVSQLRGLLDSLPPLPGTIQAIQFLRSDGVWIDRAAILTQGKNSGWQIFVFQMQGNRKFALEWKSGKLDDSFAVSSANEFETYNSFGEQTFKFSGCAAHACPDVFSVMVYVPSKKMALTATYTWGKVTYPPPADGPSFQVYRNYLGHLIAQHRNIAN